MPPGRSILAKSETFDSLLVRIRTENRRSFSEFCSLATLRSPRFPIGGCDRKSVHRAFRSTPTLQSLGASALLQLHLGSSALRQTGMGVIDGICGGPLEAGVPPAQQGTQVSHPSEPAPSCLNGVLRPVSPLDSGSLGQLGPSRYARLSGAHSKQACTRAENATYDPAISPQIITKMRSVARVVSGASGATPSGRLS
jgi:hypothetical protein